MSEITVGVLNLYCEGRGEYSLNGICKILPEVNRILSCKLIFNNADGVYEYVGEVRFSSIIPAFFQGDAYTFSGSMETGIIFRGVDIGE